MSGKRTSTPLNAASSLGAALADTATLELDGRLLGPAEEAEVLALLEDDLLAVDADLELVALSDAENLAQLGRKDDASQLVDLPDDAGRLHQLPPGRSW